MADVKQWITVNGQHVPIMEGQSKADTVKKFTESRKNKTVRDKKNKVNKVSEEDISKALDNLEDAEEFFDEHMTEEEFDEYENAAKFQDKIEIERKVMRRYLQNKRDKEIASLKQKSDQASMRKPNGTVKDSAHTDKAKQERKQAEKEATAFRKSVEAKKEWTTWNEHGQRTGKVSGKTGTEALKKANNKEPKTNYKKIESLMTSNRSTVTQFGGGGYQIDLSRSDIQNTKLINELKRQGFKPNKNGDIWRK